MFSEDEKKELRERFGNVFDHFFYNYSSLSVLYVPVL
jgi:hypothetical protein